MRTLLTMVTLLALAGVTLALPSDPCASAVPQATRILQITGGSPDTTVYVDERADVGVFLYLESNGIWTPKPAGVYVGDPEHADLQRGPTRCDFVPCEIEIGSDPCWDERSFEAGPDANVSLGV